MLFFWLVVPYPFLSHFSHQTRMTPAEWKESDLRPPASTTVEIRLSQVNRFFATTKAFISPSGPVSCDPPPLLPPHHCGYTWLLTELTVLVLQEHFYSQIMAPPVPILRAFFSIVLPLCPPLKRYILLQQVDVLLFEAVLFFCSR